MAGRRPAPRLATFKQYREADGRFQFKLVDGDGRLLMVGLGHDSARDAGKSVARLREDAGASLTDAADGVHLGGELIGVLAPDALLDQVREALSGLAESAA